MTMHRNLPPLNALRAFEAAGRTGSFSKAGEELNVSHSSVSRHVRGLEARLGVQLFKNVSRGVELTAAGRRYLEEMTGAFNQIEDATARIAKDRVTAITLSCEPTFALKWLMLALGEFHNLRPDIEIIMDATSEIADIARNECDIAIRFCSVPPVELESDIISSSPAYPVGAPGLFGEFEGMPTREMLSNQRFLQENHAEWWHEWFAASGVSPKNPPKNSGRLRTMYAIEAAVAGQGLALVSMELVHNDIKAGRLRRYSDVGLDYGTYRLVYTKQTMRREPIQAFRNWLLDSTVELRPQVSS